jgi:hypothetical protein
MGWRRSPVARCSSAARRGLAPRHDLVPPRRGGGAARARPEATLFRGSATVLVVDDEPLVLDSTAEMAAELGYRVLRAGSGEAALAMLGAHPEVAVVLTDFAMPGMTGEGLAATVAERWPGCRSSSRPAIRRRAGRRTRRCAWRSPSAGAAVRLPGGRAAGATPESDGAGAGLPDQPCLSCRFSRLSTRG